MSIPLDRLYHYIESVAQDVYGDTVIYHFYPHGSKKIEDLQILRDYPNDRVFTSIHPQIFCHDQEPLDYNFYNSIDLHQLSPVKYPKQLVTALKKVGIHWSDYNLRAIPVAASNVYDRCILLHSEENSENAQEYQQNGFIPVYYWSHALIALDWFRYAQYHQFTKRATRKTFLIYNRAWSGTREYRLKFADLLIENNLLEHCHTSVGFVDNGISYSNHQFKKLQWKPTNILESYFKENIISSCSSADFDINNYETTDIEVVLETLFDDSRIHLTEKILRPIACKQPFIIVGPTGSLKYLRKYGFQTFGNVIDESYDDITDPLDRLMAIIKVLNNISKWTDAEKFNNLQQMSQISSYNQKYFFSDTFFSIIDAELRNNLRVGLEIAESTNTGKRFIHERKLLAHDPNIKLSMVTEQIDKKRQDTCYILSNARKYYNKYLSTSK